MVVDWVPCAVLWLCMCAYTSLYSDGFGMCWGLRVAAWIKWMGVKWVGDEVRCCKPFLTRREAELLVNIKPNGQAESISHSATEYQYIFFCSLGSFSIGSQTFLLFFFGCSHPVNIAAGRGEDMRRCFEKCFFCYRNERNILCWLWGCGNVGIRGCAQWLSDLAEGFGSVGEANGLTKNGRATAKIYLIAYFLFEFKKNQIRV